MKIISCLLFCMYVITANAQRADLLNSKDLKSFIGKWNGKLEYVDYKDDKTVVVLNTKLDITGAGDSLVMQYTYTEKNGKIIKDKEVWKIMDFGEQLLDNKERADISEVRRTENSITITIHRLGKDNNKQSMIRKTIAVSGDALIISKQVKYDNADNYFVRNMYTFSKN